MDEVQHRRRRTRSARAAANASVPADADAPNSADARDPADPSNPGVASSAGGEDEPRLAVTPAHVADRTAAFPVSPAAPPASQVGLPAPIAPDPAPARPAAARGVRSSHDHGPVTERHLPFDAHSSHPAHDEREGERGLRGLVGSGATQVSVTAALRARDAARPTEADMAAVEASLAIVHRGWVPRDPV
jgi:hypothetical protein